VVFGNYGPTVFLGAVLDVALARIDHGLNGEGHAFHQLFQRTGPAIVQHLGFFMETQTNAVATKLAHHAEAMSLGKLLDGVADVTQMDAGLDHFDAVPQGVIGEAAKAFGGNGRITHCKHAAGVAVPAVLDDGDVHIDDIAFF
jgi:hypothetical protein